MDDIIIRYLPRSIRTKLEGRHAIQKALSNTGWLFLEQIIRMVIGLLVGVWVARYLGPEQFGQINYAVAFVALFGIIASMGLDGIVIRDIVRKPSCKNEILGTSFSIKLVSGIVVFCLIMGAVYLVRPDEPLIHWLVGIIAAGTIFQSLEVINLWFQSQVQSKYTVFAKNIALLTVSAIRIVLILMKAPLIAFAWAGLTEIILGSMMLAVSYKFQGGYFKAWRVRMDMAKGLLRDSWPLIFSTAFVIINLQIDKIMVGEISGDKELGSYAAAARLSEIWYMIPLIIGASIAPALTEERYNDRQSYKAKLQKAYDILSILALSLALPITFLSKKIILLLYGLDYINASLMLSIHIWSALFVFHVSLRTRSLIIENHQRIIAAYAFLTVVSNILLNYVLIPLYGGIGASWASLASWSLCVLLFPYILRDYNESVYMFLRSLNVFGNIKGYKQ